MQTKNPKQQKPPTKRTGHLLLDDFLARIGQIRSSFQLPIPQFGLKEMEQYPRVREVLGILIQSTIDWHGTGIYARPHPLLSEISRHVYLKPFSQKFIQAGEFPQSGSPGHWKNCSRYHFKLFPNCRKDSKPDKPDYNPRKLRLLESHLHKLSKEASTLLHKKETLARLQAYFAKRSEADQARLLRVAEEMCWAADTLNATIANTRLVSV